MHGFPMAFDFDLQVGVNQTLAGNQVDRASQNPA